MIDEIKSQNSSKKQNIVTFILLVVLLCVSLVMLKFACKFYIQKAYPTKYSDLVNKYATEFGFEPELIYAIIYTESDFDSKAVSKADAKGLMQLTDETFEWAKSRLYKDEDEQKNLFDPEVNIKHGVATLSLLRERFEVEETFLAAYNAGYGNVEKWLSDAKYSSDGVRLFKIPFEETRNYVVKVQNAEAIYHDLYS